MASPTPSSYPVSGLTPDGVTLEELTTKIREILGDETPDQGEGKTREKANIQFIMGSHRGSTIFGYVYEKSKGFHASVEKNLKNFDWMKTVSTKPHPVVESHLRKMTNPKAGDLRILIHWYTYLHGGKIGPDDTQTRGKLLKLLHSIGGTPDRAILAGVDTGLAHNSSVVATCTSILLPNVIGITETIKRLSAQGDRSALLDSLSTGFHIVSFLTPTWNPMTATQPGMKIPDTDYLRRYLSHIATSQKWLDIGAWNYYDRVANALKTAGLRWESADSEAGSIEFLSQLKEISINTQSPLLTYHFTVGTAEKSRPWLVYVQQPPRRRLQDMSLAGGFEAFRDTTKGLIFLPQYENIREFALQIRDQREADLFYPALLHSIGPAEHPLGNLAEAYQDAFEWARKMFNEWASVNGEINKLKDEYNNTMTENSKLKGERDNAMTENSKLKDEYNNAMTENDNLKSRINALEAELAITRCREAEAPNTDNDWLSMLEDY